MNTLQHTAIFAMGMAEKRNVTLNSAGSKLREFEVTLRQELPFLLLPDAIRAYLGARQTSHFEQLPDGSEISWMEFPSAKILKKLSKNDFNENVKFSLAESYPKCVIGEETHLSEFDVHNWEHTHHSAIRCHLVQDICLDNILRERMIDASRRFEDIFVIRHNGQTINGAELRSQIAIFERLGFLKLVGSIYEKTGFLLTRQWFEANVLVALENAYPSDLESNTYKYMWLDDELNARIANGKFELTEEKKASVIITDDLDRILDELYSSALLATMENL